MKGTEPRPVCGNALFTQREGGVWSKGKDVLEVVEGPCRPPVLPDAGAGVREDQGTAADLDAGMLGSFLRRGVGVEGGGGGEGVSDLPSLTASERASAHAHAHARTELPLGYSCRAPQTMSPCGQQS